jgi:hypothetical protein
MAQVIREGDRLVLELSDGFEASNWKGFNFQLLSPLLLGLLVPFMAINYVDPEAMRHLKMPIFLFLVAMFFVCTALFFYTAHFPGQIHSIAVHREARTIEITWRSMLATTSQIVPFDDITALRSRTTYDDDGYSQQVSELVLQSTNPIQLPADTSEEQLRPLRAAIGLG